PRAVQEAADRAPATDKGHRRRQRRTTGSGRDAASVVAPAADCSSPAVSRWSPAHHCPSSGASQ
ncbi:hypothetical protein FS749_013357, partial [Ceratobasidium sp. UAMH 11750]